MLNQQIWKDQQIVEIGRLFGGAQYKDGFKLILQISEDQNNKYYNKSIQMLLHFYHQTPPLTDQHIQQYIHHTIPFLSQTPQNHFQQKSLICLLFDKLIQNSSLKYFTIIYKSIYREIPQYSNIARYKFLAWGIPKFARLLFQPSFEDIEEIIEDFGKIEDGIFMGIKKEEQIQWGDLLVSTGIQSRAQFLRQIMQINFMVNQKRLENVKNFINQLMSQLCILSQRLTKIHKFEVQIIKIQSSKNLFDQIILFVPQLLSKFQFLIITSLKLPIIWVKAIIKKYQIGDKILDNWLFNQSSTVLILINSINYSLIDELKQPPRISNYQQSLIIQAYDAIVSFLSEINLQNQENHHFVLSNFLTITELIQKTNIFTGMLSQTDPLHKKITKVFTDLPFLNPSHRQHIFRSLLKKHYSNMSFRTHCITQYRKLINKRCEKSIWFKVTQVLFDCLKDLQPKDGVDYIGHLISFGFYWKNMTIKLQKDQQTDKYFVNFNDLFKRFTIFLTKIQKILELKQKVTQSHTSETQRNEITIILYRITQILQL